MNRFTEEQMEKDVDLVLDLSPEERLAENLKGMKKGWFWENDPEHAVEGYLVDITETGYYVSQDRVLKNYSDSRPVPPAKYREVTPEEMLELLKASDFRVECEVSDDGEKWHNDTLCDHIIYDHTGECFGTAERSQWKKARIKEEV